MTETNPINSLNVDAGRSKSSSINGMFKDSGLARLYNDYIARLKKQEDATYVSPQGDTFYKDKYTQDAEKFAELEYRALNGDIDAVEELISMHKGSRQMREFIAKLLESVAMQGDPTINEMLFNRLGNNKRILGALVCANGEHAQEAAEKLIDMIDIDPSKRMITGQDMELPMTSQLESMLLENLAKNIDHNIDRIGKFKYTLAGATLISEIAINKPTRLAGIKAATMLGDAFVNGDHKTANVALKGLETSAFAGNKESVRTLGKIARNNPNIKGFQAVEVLTKIAANGSHAGSENSDTALGELLNIAKDKKVSSKIRNKVIESLGELIAKGENSPIDTLVSLARDPAVAQKARSTLFKLAESNPVVLNKCIGLLSDVARGNLTGDRSQATQLLTKATNENISNSDTARKTIVSLAQNPNDSLAQQAIKNI